MPRRAPPLAAAKIKTSKPGRICDGAATGLYLFTRDADHKYWIFRFSRDRKMREMGLGAAVGPGAVPLAKARDRARELYQAVRDGLDPLDKRDADKVKARLDASIEASKNMSFDECRDAYIAAHEASWRNAKHRHQWLRTLQTYASPCFGHVPVGAVNIGFVMAVLDGIWTEKPETASRVRGRIESVLDWATAREYRTGENPARWASLKYMLPARSKIAGVKHHAALPFRDIGDFMILLRRQSGNAALALEYIILTAARLGEVRNATWAEIDLEGRLWVIPASHTKTNRDHRVPLGAPAMAILNHMAGLRTDDRPGALVFPGAREGRPLSDASIVAAVRAAGSNVTIHGFRSSFRDWAGELTNFPREVAEQALAHQVGNAVENAYRRGDALEKRRLLMDAWSTYCARPATTGDVINLTDRKNG
jgi:integrase